MSAKKSDGGPAFPRTGNAYAPDCTGMTLRDWFAGQALAGLLAFPGTLDGDATKYPNVTARLAYDYADRMLKERSTNG